MWELWELQSQALWEHRGNLVGTSAINPAASMHRQILQMGTWFLDSLNARSNLLNTSPLSES